MSVDREPRQLPAPAFEEYTGFLLHRLGIGAQRVIEETLRPLDLRPREFRVLALLGDTPRSQRELAELSRLDRTTMVAVVDRLEDLELVRRTRNATDRRKYLVERTAAGASLVGDAMVKLIKAEREFLSPLPEDRQTELNALLRELYAVRIVDC
ncbi:MarR family winged helix-turn-helix transcriptional regulator [Prauserella oleivorans]|uniref:MarR family winged helix-turn-helix transcriptional regulator n=1 Tax=Prauserella oleivorans TaxID=1478153 RepID=A0ABW5WI32_9PSEU